MNRGFSKSKECKLGEENPFGSKYRKELDESNGVRNRMHPSGDGVFHRHNLPVLISIIAIAVLILPASAKADFNTSANSSANTSIDHNAYLNGFDEGYKLGVMVVLAQGNATIAEEYNVLVQQHNDLLNKTLSEENAESNLIAKVPMPSTAPAKKPYDPWEL